MEYKNYIFVSTTLSKKYLLSAKIHNKFLKKIIIDYPNRTFTDTAPVFTVIIHGMFVH